MHYQNRYVMFNNTINWILIINHILYVVDERTLRQDDDDDAPTTRQRITADTPPTPMPSNIPTPSVANKQVSGMTDFTDSGNGDSATDGLTSAGELKYGDENNELTLSGDNTTVSNSSDAKIQTEINVEGLVTATVTLSISLTGFVLCICFCKRKNILSSLCNCLLRRNRIRPTALYADLSETPVSTTGGEDNVSTSTSDESNLIRFDESTTSVTSPDESQQEPGCSVNVPMNPAIAHFMNVNITLPHIPNVPQNIVPGVNAPQANVAQNIVPVVNVPHANVAQNIAPGANVPQIIPSHPNVPQIPSQPNVRQNIIPGTGVNAPQNIARNVNIGGNVSDTQNVDSSVVSDGDSSDRTINVVDTTDGGSSSDSTYTKENFIRLKSPIYKPNPFKHLKKSTPKSGDLLRDIDNNPFDNSPPPTPINMRHNIPLQPMVIQGDRRGIATRGTPYTAASRDSHIGPNPNAHSTPVLGKNKNKKAKTTSFSSIPTPIKEKSSSKKGESSKNDEKEREEKTKTPRKSDRIAKMFQTSTPRNIKEVEKKSDQTPVNTNVNAHIEQAEGLIEAAEVESPERATQTSPEKRLPKSSGDGRAIPKRKRISFADKHTHFGENIKQKIMGKKNASKKPVPSKKDSSKSDTTTASSSRINTPKTSVSSKKDGSKSDSATASSSGLRKGSKSDGATDSSSGLRRSASNPNLLSQTENEPNQSGDGETNMRRNTKRSRSVPPFSMKLRETPKPKKW